MNWVNKLFSFRVIQGGNQVIGTQVHVAPDVRGGTGAGMSSQGQETGDGDCF